MTAPQAKLLKKLIEAERGHRTNPGIGHPWREWIEVGPFVGIAHSTVDSLTDKGLIETQCTENNLTQARLLPKFEY